MTTDFAASRYDEDGGGENGNSLSLRHEKLQAEPKVLCFSESKKLGLQNRPLFGAGKTLGQRV